MYGVSSLPRFHRTGPSTQENAFARISLRSAIFVCLYPTNTLSCGMKGFSMRPIFSRILRTGSLVFCLLALFSLTLTQSPIASAQTGPSLASLAQQGEQACLQPPRQIHLSLLTDQQLVSYGLPSHAIIAKN